MLLAVPNFGKLLALAVHCLDLESYVVYPYFLLFLFLTAFLTVGCLYPFKHSLSLIRSHIFTLIDISYKPKLPKAICDMGHEIRLSTCGGRGQAVGIYIEYPRSKLPVVFSARRSAKPSFTGHMAYNSSNI